MVVHGLGSLRRLAAGTACASALTLAAGVARADDPAPGAAPPAGPAPPAGAASPSVGSPTRARTEVPLATDPPAERSALREAVEGVLGAEVHGRFTLEWESRVLKGEGENDHDLYSALDLRVGDEEKDEWSAAVFVRTDWDLDHPDSGGDSDFGSLADTFDHDLSTLLYTAYGTWRPATGRIESVRFGRQYVDVAETFHVDGAAVVTKPMWDRREVRLRAYGGVPVHFYESSPQGDWIAGLQATSEEPWKGGRAAVDAAHVDDRRSGYDEDRNDLLAAQAWHELSPAANLYGRFTWLDRARDAKVRASLRVPEQDLVLQASVFRLLQEEEQLATEYDPYYEVLRTLQPYYLLDGRVVKGFGETTSVELGVSSRQLADEDDEGEYNRETTRWWLMPTFDDLLWKDSSVSVGGELWDGQDESIRTWSFDFTQRFGRDARLSLGTDFQRYDYDELSLGEREDVRTVYARLRMKVTESATLDIRYSWERDEEDTYHVVSLALAFGF